MPMLVFVLSLIAGFATPMFEPTVKTVMSGRVKDIKIEAAEYRTLAFALLLLGVAILASVTGSDAPIFTVLLGGLLGLFGTRLIAFAKAKWAERSDAE